MARNICKDKKEFFKTLYKYLRKDEECDFADDYGSFSKISKDQWESLIYDNYLSDILEIILYANEKKPNIDYSIDNCDNGGKFVKGGIRGFQQLDTGECIMGFDAGGDCDVAVNAVIYIEDGEAKTYVPEKGNSFCEETKSVYKWNGLFDDEKRDGEAPNFLTQKKFWELNDESRLDSNALLEDIKDYFQNRGEFEHADGTTYGG